MSQDLVSQDLVSMIPVPTSSPHLDDGEERGKKTDKDSKLPNPIEVELFEARIVMISAPIEAKLAHAVNAKLYALERANAEKPIYVLINSPGGEIQSGFSIFDTIRFIRPRVYTVVTGLAASMGSIIALAASPEDRFAFPNSKFLVHQPLIAGGLAGSATDIAIHAKDLIETKNKIIDLYATETKKSRDDIKKAIDRDNWMSPEAARDFGLITKIVTKRTELP
jgi:ATP-dependent Clp protease protease subunit